MEWWLWDEPWVLLLATVWIEEAEDWMPDFDCTCSTRRWAVLVTSEASELEVLRPVEAVVAATVASAAAAAVLACSLWANMTNICLLV